MNQTTPIQPSSGRKSWGFTPFALATGFLLVTLLDSPATAQAIPGCPSDLWYEPVLPRNVATISSSLSGDGPSFLRGNSCRLFRMPTVDPVGLDSDDDSVVNEADTPGGSSENEAAGDGRLKVALGADNPYFDFRRPGDPGGVGFYRLYSQALLFDNQKTGLSMGLQAVTPAGLDADGLADGPTILSPHFAWFHEVGDGTAIQGFVGKNLRAPTRTGPRVLASRSTTAWRCKAPFQARRARPAKASICSWKPWGVTAWTATRRNAPPSTGISCRVSIGDSTKPGGCRAGSSCRWVRHIPMPGYGRLPAHGSSSACSTW